MKKSIALLMAIMMALSLVACGGDTEGGNVADDKGNVDGSYKIAIVKQMDHASLNEISDAIEEELANLAESNNIEISCKVFSGQNDSTLLGQIGSQIVAEDYDAVIPIATLAAQCMVTAMEDTKTPVIFAAVSDPETAGITGLDYVTGISDALDTEMIMNMMLAQNPEIQTVGLLYSLSEPNSTKPIEQAKKFLDAKGLKYIEKTGNTNEEIIMAATSLGDQVEAIFTPTDNVVMAAELTLAELFISNGIPHYTGADSFVRNGAFVTCGVNYTNLGKVAAEMTIDVLEDGVVSEYRTMEGGIITVNTETAEAMKLDYSMFQDMATIVEVTTSEN